MIDMATYKRLHLKDAEKRVAPRVTGGRTGNRDSETAEDLPFDGDEMYLFPPTIIGYNMRVKKWGELEP